LESEADQVFPEIGRSHSEQKYAWILTNVFADVAAHRMVPDLINICSSWKPDVIVRNTYEFGACVAAEILRIPHATVGVDFFVPAHQLRPFINDQMAYLRSAHGLSPYPALDMLYRQLYLAFAPPSYERPNIPLPPVYHSRRPVIVDQIANEELPAWIDHLPKRPTVCATLGSVFNRAPEIFRAIIEGLSQEPINLIITTGQNQDPAQFGPQPANVRIERYIPQSLLFSRCDLVIAHGGSNTTMSALSHGLPIVFIPRSANNPAHALRCAELGVGVIIKTPDQFPSYLDHRAIEFSHQAIRGAVRELLENPAYRRNARRLRNEIMSLPAPEKVIQLITKLAVEQAPRSA
jgi:UDP:flavonoid glycosyltransferase YjiC (YdhE family)